MLFVIESFLGHMLVKEDACTLAYLEGIGGPTHVMEYQMTMSEPPSWIRCSKPRKDYVRSH